MSNISGNQGPQGLDRYNPLYKAEGTSDAPATRKARFGSHNVEMAPQGKISWLLRKMYDSVAYFFGGASKGSDEDGMAVSAPAGAGAQAATGTRLSMSNVASQQRDSKSGGLGEGDLNKTSLASSQRSSFGVISSTAVPVTAAFNQQATVDLGRGSELRDLDEANGHADSAQELTSQRPVYDKARALDQLKGLDRSKETKFGKVLKQLDLTSEEAAGYEEVMDKKIVTEKTDELAAAEKELATAQENLREKPFLTNSRQVGSQAFVDTNKSHNQAKQEVTSLQGKINTLRSELEELKKK